MQHDALQRENLLRIWALRLSLVQFGSGRCAAESTFRLRIRAQKRYGQIFKCACLAQQSRSDSLRGDGEQNSIIFGMYIISRADVESDRSGDVE